MNKAYTCPIKNEKRETKNKKRQEAKNERRDLIEKTSKQRGVRSLEYVREQYTREPPKNIEREEQLSVWARWWC